MDGAVIDASAVVELLRSPSVARQLADTIGEPELRAPDLLNAEVVHALRRLERVGEMDDARVAASVRALTLAPIDRVSTTSLLDDIWSLRRSLTAYDASYVALARADECPLVTFDAKLARAPGLGVEVIVFSRRTP